MEPLLSWLLSPWSGAAHHEIAGWAAWHARLMVLAWGILIPLGVFAARFYKVVPRQNWPQELDNKTWWNAHRWLQAIAVVCMTIGLILVLAFGTGANHSTTATIHAAFGWFLCLCGWLQILIGLLRGSKGGPTDKSMRGDHYDMSPWRRWFERVHKGLGWAAVVIAIPTIGVGLQMSDAPRWMACVLVLWWAAMIAWFVRLQRTGRCIDTYQAIWGPDEAHPGNQRQPIGWGIRRYSAGAWRERSGS